MWKDLVDRAELLKRSPVVRHLIDTPKHSYGDGTAFPEPARLDREYPPAACSRRSRPTPLSSPRSWPQPAARISFVRPSRDRQEPDDRQHDRPVPRTRAHRAVRLAEDRRFGGRAAPPQGDRARRLLPGGPFDQVAEIRRARPLRRAWHERTTPSQGAWDAATSELASLREELNGLVSALHRRRENGLSAYEAFGRVIAAGSNDMPLVLAWPDHLAHDEAVLATLRASCRELRPVLASVGSLVDHPLHGVEATQWSPVWRDDMGAAIRTVEQTLGALRVSGHVFADAIRTARSALDPCRHARAHGVGNYLVRPEVRCGAAFLADGYRRSPPGRRCA